MNESDLSRWQAMNEIIPNLWIGDLSAALAADLLQAHNIKFIISAMRGRVKINPHIRKHQIPLDDVPDADVLEHIEPCNALIEATLARNEGLLVHCQAGQSRSVTIVAAFLMHSRNLDPDSALSLIREVRPSIAPNEGFLHQLWVYHRSTYTVSKKDKSIRAFYMERAVKDILNGDGSDVRADMFAKFPYTPGTSTPSTPIMPRRRIRCKLCRRELAAREHMMDHGQLSPPTPAALSRASSFGESPRGRRNSALTGLRMSRVDDEATMPPNEGERSNSRKSSFSGGLAGALKMTPLPDSGESAPSPLAALKATSGWPYPTPEAPRNLEVRSDDESALYDSDEGEGAVQGELSGSDGFGPMSTSPLPQPPILLSPSEISAQLPTSLAALRRSSLVAALKSTTTSPTRTPSNYAAQNAPPLPILANPACSGYFVEPMAWMDSFLQEGNMAGKVLCPNERCKAKLGNYDWAGVACGCKEWVTPGFCIARAKVDETV